MKYTKIYELVKDFSKWEINHLIQFIESPYYNSNDFLTKLLHQVVKYINGESTVIDKKEIFLLLNPKEVYDDQKMRLSISQLYKLVVLYMSTSNFEKDIVTQDLYALQGFQQINKHKIFSALLLDTENKMTKSKNKDIKYYEHSYKIEELRYLDKKNQKRTDYDFTKMIDALDIYYFAQKFRYECIALSHEWMSKSKRLERDIWIESFVIKDRPELLEIPTIAVYFYGYKILKSPEIEENFVNYERLLDQHLKLFPKDEAVDLILMGTNYCIRRLNNGDTNYASKTFELYKLGINNGAFLEKGYLSRFSFKNIVTLGLKLKEYVWTEKFVIENIKHLEEKYRESSFAYNMANIAYEKKDYEKALQLLQKADYDDIFIMLANKNILLKIYYELEYNEPLEYLIGSMLMLIRRRGLEQVYKNNYTNICNVVKKLYVLKTTLLEDKKMLNNKKKLLLKYIQNTKPLTERDWLLKQLEKLN